MSTKKPNRSTIKRLPLEDCFKREGGTYRFGELTSQHIEFLKPFGNLQVFNSFPRPFFRIDKPRFFRLKGTIGLRDIVVVVKEDATEDVLEILENQLAKLETCTLCKECVEICPNDAIVVDGFKFYIQDEKCTHCLDCVRHICPHIRSKVYDIG